MFELLFLLLPIAAAYGYYMGQMTARSKKQQSKNNQNTNYLRGVEYLLDNRKDQAVDKFIAYLNEKDPSFESAVALGNLFRKRGEVDKAIALHEKLSSDEELEDAEHEISQIELAQDFISAGLLDRAEEILVELVEIPRQRKSAATLLLKVYEREQDFDKAIEVALSYRSELGDAVSKQLGQYYCQKANDYKLKGMKQEAIAAYRYALEIFKNSLRARLELADLYIEAGKLKEAYTLIHEVSELDSHSGLLCLEYVRRCFPNKADPNYRFALGDLIRRTASSEAMVELVRVIEQTSGYKDAEAELASCLKEKTTLKLFSALMGLRAREATDANNAETIQQIKSYVDAKIAASPKYTCHNCGFESKMMFWQCPSCRKWESMHTKSGLDGD
ncbi:MAG: tetratricopeptide repeat protein [Succinivibrio sp.]|nr:tetratricopeptide repeat protein [Succinivibrio sp.]